MSVPFARVAPVSPSIICHAQHTLAELDVHADIIREASERGERPPTIPRTTLEGGTCGWHDYATLLDYAPPGPSPT